MQLVSRIKSEFPKAIPKREIQCTLKLLAQLHGLQCISVRQQGNNETEHTSGLKKNKNEVASYSLFSHPRLFF